MTRREDGSVIMPPMTRLQQCYLFQGFVSGYAHATGEAVDLWSMVGGDVLYVYDAKSGTRSPSLDRSQHLDSEIFERTVADLLDDRSKWTPSGAPQILGADQPLFCDQPTMTEIPLPADNSHNDN